MSDGAALSQAEIDALLNGVDSGFRGGSPSPSGSGVSESERKAFQAILEETAGPQSNVYSSVLGPQSVVSGPTVENATRDQMLQSLPEQVVAVEAMMSGGIPGEHLLVFTKDTALKIASLANGEEGLTDIDEMGLNVIQELVSQLSGSQITAFSKKTGNNSIQSDPASAKFGEKALVSFPMNDFIKVTYPVKIGDNPPEKVWEIFSTTFVKDLVLASGGGVPDLMGFDQPQGGQKQQGGGMNQQQQQQQQQQQMYGQMQGGGQYGQQQYGQQQFGQQQPMGMPFGMGGQPYGMPQGGFSGMNPPNVQSLQFPNLMMGAQGGEQSNISLLMDVFMEMTVELGRTKKPIREILGMGEGTIIELDKLSGEPVDILVNHKLIAKGEVVVIDENFGVRVTEIVSPMERVSDMG